MRSCSSIRWWSWGALIQDPKAFAFLNPFLLIMIVRSGIRFGIRTMYLSWATTLAASTMLLTSAYWRGNVELTLTLVLMLAFVPVFFASLVRRIHKVRAIEEELAPACRLDAAPIEEPIRRGRGEMPPATFG